MWISTFEAAGMALGQTAGGSFVQHLTVSWAFLAAGGAVALAAVVAVVGRTSLAPPIVSPAIHDSGR
jgi:hypothetical protein